MKNLGRSMVVWVLCMAATLYGSVVATVDPSVVYTGESAHYQLTIEGERVSKPKLTEICGNEIIATSLQTKILMENMQTTKKYIFSYEFVPKKSCRVDPVRVIVDAKEEFSNPVDVIVKPASAQKDAPFILELQASKRELFVGEPFDVTLTIKQSQRTRVVDSKFVEPDFKGFWIKKRSQPQRTKTAAYLITQLHYRLAPQREGNLTIEPVELRIASRAQSRNDLWGSMIPQIKWRSYFSNSVVVHAKPLPNNAKLVGDFTIKAVADKTTIAPNEAVNVTVTVEGEGNLEDIPSFEPHLQGVSVFAQKIEIDGDRLRQKLAFVGDSNFTIPAFKLAFYNLEKKRVEQITTQPIAITVEGSSAVDQDVKIHKAAPQLQDQDTKSRGDLHKQEASLPLVGGLVVFFTGLFCGIVLMLWRPWRGMEFQRTQKALSMKDTRGLLMKLLPFREDPEVAALIEELEANLYSGTSQPIDKKKIKRIAKRYNIL